MQIAVQLMDEAAMNRTLMRMSYEICEKNKDMQDLCLIGICRRGERLARIIAENIKQTQGVTVPCGSLDIKYYRDDLTTIGDSPVLNDSELPFCVTDKKIVIVDDVLFTGRTVRAAIEGIFAGGRPKKIQLAVLIDRGHRELPLKADYVGKNIATSLAESVAVKIPPYDEERGVFLLKQQ